MYKAGHYTSVCNSVVSDALHKCNGSVLSYFPNHLFFESKRSLGYSLLELLFALSIALILISVSLPSMRALIVNNQISNVSDELYNTLMFARSESIKRKKSVSLCRTLNNQTCDQNGDTWQSGWLIFTDKNEDGIFNGDDFMVRKVIGQFNSISISWNRGFNIRFNGRGQTTQAGTFRICDQLGNLDSKSVIVSMTGRFRTEDKGPCS